MAYEDGGAYSYGDKATKESLWDQIRDLDPIENYVTSSSSEVDVSQKVHSWVSDPITPTTSAPAGVVEMTATVFAATNPVLFTNTTQIIEKGFAVSGTDQNSKHAGFSDRFAREQLKAMKMWKNDLEYSAVSGSLVSGTGSAARKMKGISGFSSLISTLASGVSLTSAMLDLYLSNAWNVAGNHDTVLVGQALKSRISMFTAGNTRNIPAKDAELVGRVDVYDSDSGRVEIRKHRYINAASATIGNVLMTYIKDYIHVGFLDKPHYEDRARTGYFKAGAIVGEATVQVDNMNAIQVISSVL